MTNYKNILCPALLLLTTIPAAIFAQSVTVLSTGTEARACALAAETAASLQMASREDADVCTRALDIGNLTARDKAATYTNRGIVLLTVERNADAFSDYNRALNLLPDLAEAYVGRGNVYFVQGAFDLAIADYNKALELQIKRNHIPLFNLGMAQEKLGNLAAAEQSYRQALTAMPQWNLAEEKLELVQEKQQGTTQ